jgi:hypothetical protein
MRIVKLTDEALSGSMDKTGKEQSNVRLEIQSQLPPT